MNKITKFQNRCFDDKISANIVIVFKMVKHKMPRKMA